MPIAVDQSFKPPFNDRLRNIDSNAGRDANRDGRQDDRFDHDLNPATLMLGWVMDRKLTILERAFELSADGFHKNMEHIQHTLRCEGYENVGQHFSSMTLKRQMRARINAVSKS